MLKYRSFYISSFQILTPTPVGVQISEDVPVPGKVLVAEGIRVPENIRVPEGVRVSENIRVPEHYRVPGIVWYSTEENWNYPTRPEKMFYPHTPIQYEMYTGKYWADVNVHVNPRFFPINSLCKRTFLAALSPQTIPLHVESE